MLLLVSTLKLLAEIAGLALLGQGVVGWLSGAGRDANPVYRVFSWVTAPVLAATRRVAPRFVAERHLPPLALLGVAVVWVAATAAKIAVCLQIGLQACR
jgi:hypothetical protein